MLPTCSLPQNFAPRRPLAPHNYPTNSPYPQNCQPPWISFLPNLGYYPTYLTSSMPTPSPGPLHVIVSLSVHIRRLASRPFKAPILFRPRRLLLRIVPNAPRNVQPSNVPRQVVPPVGVPSGRNAPPPQVPSSHLVPNFRNPHHDYFPSCSAK